MKKNAVVEYQGVVVEVLPDANFRVQLDIDRADGVKPVILAYTSGTMRERYIKISIGDAVKVEMSPTDFKRGRIVYRYKK